MQQKTWTTSFGFLDATIKALNEQGWRIVQILDYPAAGTGYILLGEKPEIHTHPDRRITY